MVRIKLAGDNKKKRILLIVLIIIALIVIIKYGIDNNKNSNYEFYDSKYGIEKGN